MKVVFAGGGTGGHLFPGIALAEEMLRRVPDSSILFATAGRPVEERILKNHPFRRTVIGAPRSPYGPAQKALAAPRLGLAILRARRLLREFDPHLVVGLGGYASVPVVWAAGKRRPIFLIEQNAVPGRATRMIFRRARRIFIQFDRTAELLPKRAPCLKTGTPIRKGLLLGGRAQAVRHFRLSPRRKTVLVLGGSQGARGVNEIIAEILPRLARRAGSVQILHQTGDADYRIVRTIYVRTGIRAHVARMIERMDLAYALADVVVCRAGATTIAELTALGLPSVLVPYPYSLDGEQHENAAQLAQQGAAFMVEQSQTAAREVYEHLTRLLDEPGPAEKTVAQARALGYPDATETVVSDILKTIGMEKRRAGLAMYEGILAR